MPRVEAVDRLVEEQDIGVTEQAAAIPSRWPMRGELAGRFLATFSSRRPEHLVDARERDALLSAGRAVL